MYRLLIQYVHGLVDESIRPSWAAVNGLLGAFLGAAAMIWRGVLPIVSTDLTSLPNWVVSFAIYAIGSWFTLFMGNLILAAPFRLWNKEHTMLRKAEMLVAHPIIDIEHCYLYCQPPKNESWNAAITLLRASGAMRICLTVQTYLGGMGQHIWSERKRWTLLELANVAHGEQNLIELIELDSTGSAPFWRWAAAVPTDTNTAISRTCHRCQLVFMPQQGRYDYFDFYLYFHERTPSLMGEHLFLYAREWKKIDATTQSKSAI